MNMGNQHLIHRHGTIFPTPNRQNTKKKHKHIKYKNEIQICVQWLHWHIAIVKEDERITSGQNMEGVKQAEQNEKLK